MIKGGSIVLLIAGVAMLVLGVQASKSFNSEVSRFFTGSPTDKAMWLLIAGAASAGLGLFGLLRRSR